MQVGCCFSVLILHDPCCVRGPCVIFSSSVIGRRSDELPVWKLNGVSGPQRCDGPMMMVVVVKPCGTVLLMFALSPLILMGFYVCVCCMRDLCIFVYDITVMTSYQIDPSLHPV
ncbi:hypothetical protein CHARACLAT_004080 [Characodon lateralis]|uniref:Uncharacterized protein n=1 Tax=Characodon lateralis TaxID=208331 RepID=A0ABU7F0C1_9TELE|nr:hypothetical protein [Characodon lateralis]